MSNKMSMHSVTATIFFVVLSVRIKIKWFAKNAALIITALLLFVLITVFKFFTKTKNVIYLLLRALKENSRKWLGIVKVKLGVNLRRSIKIILKNNNKKWSWNNKLMKLLKFAVYKIYEINGNCVSKKINLNCKNSRIIVELAWSTSLYIKKSTIFRKQLNIQLRLLWEILQLVLLLKNRKIDVFLSR